MTAEERMRAIIAPLNEAVRKEQREGVVGPATANQERAMMAAFEDALVGLLRRKGVLTSEEWEEAFLRELQVKVATVLEAARAEAL